MWCGRDKQVVEEDGESCWRERQGAMRDGGDLVGRNTTTLESWTLFQACAWQLGHRINIGRASHESHQCVVASKYE